MVSSNESLSENATGTIVDLLSEGKDGAAKNYFSEKRNDIGKSYQYECLGHFQYFSNNFQEAVDFYESAIKINPDRIISRYQYLVGLSELREGNHTAAFERYQHAIEHDPSLVEAYEAMATLMTKIGEHEAAEKCLADAELAKSR